MNEIFDNSNQITEENFPFYYLTLNKNIDLNGDKKTGMDLEVAQVFQNYSDQTKDFHEYVEVDGMFDLELEKLENYLINVLKYISTGTRNKINYYGKTIKY